MKHSIFEPGIKESLFNRIDAIKAGTRGKWGKLSAAQMIRHVSEAGLMAFGEIAMPDRSTFITGTVIKWIFLSNIKPPGREKGKIKTFPEVDVVERKIAVEEIELEKIKYKAT